MGKLTGKSLEEYQDLIVELHDNQGMSFDSISKELERRTGKKRSRQVVFKSYRNAKGRVARSEEEYNRGLRAIHLKELGYTSEYVAEVLGVSQYTVRKSIEHVLEVEPEAEKRIHKQMIEGLAALIENGGSVQDTTELMMNSDGRYAPTKKMWERSMKEACVLVMEKRILEYSRKLSRRYGCHDIGRETARCFGVTYTKGEDK